MRRLNPLTMAWRDFFYAYHDGYFNDNEEIGIRVQMIQDERENILEQVLKSNPDWKLVEESKQEINFQLEEVEDIVKEFSQQYTTRYRFGIEPDEIQKIILEDFSSYGTESEFYLVVDEWKELAENAHQVLQGLEEECGCTCPDEIKDYLMKQMMELQVELRARENLQKIKEEMFVENCLNVKIVVPEPETETQLVVDKEVQKEIDEARLDEIAEKMSFVDEKELHPIYQAKGWERYEDGSGGLIDIHGKTLVSYDLLTKELMGSNLPFTSHKLYINYSYDSCGFKKIREDAVRWLNNNYENALEHANELVEPYRQDADNYYKVVSTENPEYPFNVQKITSGYYSGNGKFCKDIDEVKEYVEGEHLNEITDKTIEDAMEIDEARLDELAEEMLLEAQAASQGPILGM
ncbi:MAG: hypothetical protein J6B50_10375 [Lachnospiraceae bacterium]|nr:hypothetical protein [Lachnospiraceae bacterium]